MSSPRVIVAGDPITYTEAFKLWLIEHGIPPNDCYKLVLMPNSVAPELGKVAYYCYARNENKKFYLDLSTGRATILPAVTIDMKSELPGG